MGRGAGWAGVGGTGLLAWLALFLSGCLAGTEPEGRTLPEQLALVAYNGEPLPYSGRYELRGGNLVSVVCYGVEFGELVLRSGGFRLSVEGLEDQGCESGWAARTPHSGAGEYVVVGDSIGFLFIEQRGFAGRVHGHIAGDTVTLVLTRLPGLADLGDRTMTFLAR